jgi:hypothetical protein
MDFKLEKENEDIEFLKSFFKNKTVALVGSGKAEKQIMKKIKNYDVICSVNEAYFEVPILSKIDVLFTASNPTGARFIEEKIDNFKQKDIQFTIRVNPNVYIEKGVDINKEAHNKYLKVSELKGYDVSEFAKLIPGCPLTGSTSWIFLLFMELQKLYVTGFNFYGWNLEAGNHGTPFKHEVKFINKILKTSCNVKKINLSKDMKESTYFHYNNRKGINRITIKNEK